LTDGCGRGAFSQLVGERYVSLVVMAMLEDEFAER
jgi:hypothetical protein